jgi:hypothetical protein
MQIVSSRLSVQDDLFLDCSYARSIEYSAKVKSSVLTQGELSCYHPYAFCLPNLNLF